MSLAPEFEHNVYLIGDVDVQICGNQLPSKMQVLKLLFYNLREVKLSLRASANLVLREVSIFWDKARLPMQKPSRCITKIENLHEEWRTLQKHKSRETNQENETIFLSGLSDLFDIAHGHILNNIDHEQREFLENQRKPGRIGYINKIESRFVRLEQEELHRKQVIADRVERSEKEKARIDERVELASSDGSPAVTLSQQSLGAYPGASLDFVHDNDDAPPPTKKRRGRINIFTNKVVAALDVCKVSDRKAVHLISVIAEALDTDVQSLILNKTSIRLYRQGMREAKALMIKKVFKRTELKHLVLLWDGKLLFDLTKHEMVDRLPVVVTDGDIEKLLGVPQLEGRTQANAIYDVLEDWDLAHSIKALCCDTTASNLGNKNSAAVLLECLLETNILLFPCRHHIFELILWCAFECQIPSSTAPGVPLFKGFQDNWSKIDQQTFRSGIEDERVKSILRSEHVQRISSFAFDTLREAQARDDYEEFLNLTLLFPGCEPIQGVSFNYPSSFSHARWMSKANYSLKMFLFRDQLSLSSEEIKGIREMCIFIVMLYVEAWFTATKAVAAPNHDLEFLKKLYRYREVNEKISEVTVKKMSNHLWYLSAEALALSFFDDQLSITKKRQMVTELNPYDEINNIYLRKLQLDLKNIDG